MKKIVSVVGARPQFVKAAMLSRPLRESFDEVLVHTGQHYDKNMSALFFEELGIPEPDVNLGAGSGSHAVQTADMLIGVERVLVEQEPDALLVYGDTNSTLAAALAASKMLIPVIHIEAGLRSGNMAMPEEQNRILTDHLSSMLFCPTDNAVENLANEGILRNVFNLGDVMCDSVKHYSKYAQEKYGSSSLMLNDLFSKESVSVSLDEYVLITIHRAANTRSEDALLEILSAVSESGKRGVFPVHPRTAPIIDGLRQRGKLPSEVSYVDPVGYLEMLHLAGNASKILTDSGGLQKEAYILGVPCVTVRPQTEWIETLLGGWNVLTDADRESIVEKLLRSVDTQTERPAVYGDGDASSKIARAIRDCLG